MPLSPTTMDAALAPPGWDAERLREQLLPRLPGLSVKVMASCPSTNTWLVERARGGDITPCLLVAQTQTAGRGRLGRSWSSSARGASLTFSLALPYAPRHADGWQGLSLAVGVALAEALDVGTGTPLLQIKWPNDVWLAQGPGRGRKLAGILIETVVVRAQRVAVIGVGVNVLNEVAEQHAADTGIAAWEAIQPAASAPKALAAIAPALVAALQDFERSGFADFEQRFAKRDLLRGQCVSTTLAAVPQGIAEGVDSRGALLVRAQGVHALTSGDVSVRPLTAITALPAVTAGNASRP